MNKLLSTFIIALVVSYNFISPQLSPAATDGDFQTWIVALRNEATSRGIAENTIDEALSDLHQIERVLELDRKQPEFTLTFWKYLDGRVTERRVARGKKLLKKHAKLLQSIEKQYGVQPRFLVAFWGLETNFGDYLGSFPVIGSLATLAYDPRRSSFFRNELLAALQILNEGHIQVNDMKGSWAGAMGQPQFMPTTFTQNAVDQDGDGRKDIWHNLPDVFGSAANYLSRSGWNGKKTWGREVLIPDNFELSHANLKNKKKLYEWQELGIRRINGRDLPLVDLNASLFMPAGFSGPAFLVYSNYHTILKWNRSHLYAVAVGHLADRLVEKPALQSKRLLNEKPLRRSDVKEIQQKLSALGFNVGIADGVVGSQTREALTNFQTSVGIPADGYPSFEMLEKLRSTN